MSAIKNNGLIGLFLSLLFLMSCSSEIKPENFQPQREYFINTIDKVQLAGSILQKQSLSQAEITQAMNLLDETMMNAHSVNEVFLKWLDAGLYQAFSAYLIKGIESYRFGVELDDKAQQAKGIELLQKWWHFWQLKQPAITAKLDG